jgi:hypothetical protein
VAIPRQEAAALVDLAAKKSADEAKRLESIRAGKLKPAWLDAALRAAGVLKEGETL